MILHDGINNILKFKVEFFSVKLKTKGFRSLDYLSKFSLPSYNIEIVLSSSKRNIVTHIYIGIINEKNENIIKEIINQIDEIVDQETKKEEH